MKVPPVTHGTRYELPDAQSAGDGLDQLNKLIDFLGSVKSTARLRAKEEGGVKFLHTRTGTIFGQFWKKITIGSESAIAQRRLFKESIENVLDNIKVDNHEDVIALKNLITKNILEVRSDKEFDIHQLCNSLKLFRGLIKGVKTDSPQSPGTYILKTMGKERVEDVADQTAENSLNFQLPGNFPSPVSTDLTRKIPAQKIEEVEEIEKPDIPLPNDQKHMGSSGSIPPQAFNSKDTPQDQSNFVSLEPIPSRQKATGATISDFVIFGLRAIESSLSVSSKLLFSRYFADVYILPKSENLNFKNGVLTPEGEPAHHDGLVVSRASHATKNRERSFTQVSLLDLDNPKNAPETQKRLEELYRSALNQDFGSSPKAIAIKPLYLDDENLYELSIRALFEVIKTFEKTHPATAVQVVLINDVQVTFFNALKKPESNTGKLVIPGAFDQRRPIEGRRVSLKPENSPDS